VVVTGQQAQGDDDLPRIVERPEPEGPDAVQADSSTEDASAEGDVASADASPAAEAPAPSEAEERTRPAVPLRLLLLVVALNVLLALGLLTLRPPWRVERAEAPPTLPLQVAALQSRVAQGEHGTPYTLSLTDDELTATARYFLVQSEDVPFSQVRVIVINGHLEATGVTTGLAVAVPVRILANVTARDGNPVVSVADVGIGGMALPSFVREQVLREANQAVDLSRYELPVTVDVVTLRSGVLDLRGTVR
jgi:hypothetical protein